MKQRWRHLIASALVLALCLSAAACGKSDDTAGDDWRASGAVVDSGTITHDGDSVDVLVTVSESSAAFYRDMPEQVLFDSVSFPVSIPDAEEAFHAISFDDIDGDGESDVLVRFLHKSGDTTEMIWIWDPVERYVFREDLSTVAVGGARSGQPYFTRNGLQINAAVEMGTFLLEDGVCSYSGLGDGYNTDDCYWEIVKNGDYTHDGIRELHFDAICYIPEGAIPYFDQQYITVTSSELYDYYTGTWLTASTAYGNSQRGENYYLYTISWQGSSYLIEFAYSTEWEYNVSDWAQVLTKSYVVYIPENYNGLIFAAEAQPLTYKESAKRMQLDSICPEAAIMDIDTLDPYSCLFFDLCDCGRRGDGRKTQRFCRAGCRTHDGCGAVKAARRPPEAVCRLASGGAGRRNERYRLLFYGAGCIAQGDPCDGAVFRRGLLCGRFRRRGTEKAECADARAAGRLFPLRWRWRRTTPLLQLRAAWICASLTRCAGVTSVRCRRCAVCWISSRRARL